jgi:hypothetical protein
MHAYVVYRDKPAIATAHQAGAITGLRCARRSPSANTASENSDNWRVADGVDPAELDNSANKHSAKHKGCGTRQRGPAECEYQSKLDRSSSGHMKCGIKARGSSSDVL